MLVEKQSFLKVMQLQASSKISGTKPLRRLILNFALLESNYPALCQSLSYLAHIKSPCSSSSIYLQPLYLIRSTKLESHCRFKMHVGWCTSIRQVAFRGSVFHHEVDLICPTEQGFPSKALLASAINLVHNIIVEGRPHRIGQFFAND